MTKHETKRERTQFATPMFPDIGNIPNVLAQSAETYQQAFMEWQKEISTFVADRIQQDMESLQSLAEERTFPALLKVQQDWFAAALRDYTEEGRKLTDIAGRFAKFGLKPEQKQTTKAEARGAL